MSGQNVKLRIAGIVIVSIAAGALVWNQRRAAREEEAAAAKVAARKAEGHALDRMCREIEPKTLAHTPRARRVDALVAWADANVKDVNVAPLLGPLRDKDPKGTGAAARELLSSYDIHVCPMLPGLAAPTDPAPGANVIVTVLKIEDGRQAALEAALRTRIDALRSCYAAHLEKAPLLAGMLNLTLRVSEKGRLERVVATPDSTFKAEGAVACAVGELEKLSLPESTEPANGAIGLDFFRVP